MDSSLGRRIVRGIGALAIVFALASLGACAITPDGRPDNMPGDINAVFLDEEMDVEGFVVRFEGESRAVYAQRFAIVEALELSSGDVVADIGAGTGFFSFLFSDAVGRTGRVQAVEQPSEARLTRRHRGDALGGSRAPPTPRAPPASGARD